MAMVVVEVSVVGTLSEELITEATIGKHVHTFLLIATLRQGLGRMLHTHTHS